MVETTTVCFCNNRGGVGKTFTLFQIACAVAVANPDKKVLIFDFSIYSDLTALFLGGTTASGAFAASTGLVLCRENTTAETRVEGLLRRLSEGKKKSIGLGFFRAPDVAIDLLSFTVQPFAYNRSIPANLLLVPSAGTESFVAKESEKNTPWSVFKPTTADALRCAIKTLPGDFISAFFDTDHLASSPLTELALATCDSCVVPCPTDTAEFQRLYQTPNATTFHGVESLFSDVMLPMAAKGHLRARVTKMIFSKVPSIKNEPLVTAAGIRIPFTPNVITCRQIDSLASLAWEVCDKNPRYAALFAHGSTSQEIFTAETFSAFKLMPDLARSISAQRGVPICTMTTETYTTASGISGSITGTVLKALVSEIEKLASS